MTMFSAFEAASSVSDRLLSLDCALNTARWVRGLGLGLFGRGHACGVCGCSHKSQWRVIALLYETRAVHGSCGGLMVCIV